MIGVKVEFHSVPADAITLVEEGVSMPDAMNQMK